MISLDKPVLLTGATGYVGGRLLKALEAAGIRVRCLVRRPEAVSQRISTPTEVVTGDAFDADTLLRALKGIHTAYYLVHSMGSGRDFRKADREAASNFAAAAKKAGVERIVYLGGLGAGTGLSDHLRSRHEVGEILRVSGVPAIEFRASIIIGSGSLSFEMIRALVEKLPVMITPRWVRIPAQPIAIEDVIGYLVAALDYEATGSEVFEIGGADRVSYAQIMQEYALQRELRRLMIPVSLLTPKLSSLWLGLVTPIYARVGRELIDSLRNPTIVTDSKAERTFTVRPRGIRDAIRRALANEDRDIAETRWSDALSSGRQTRSLGGTRFGSRIVDSRTIKVSATPAEAFDPIARIGGDTGWYFGNWLWWLRGFLDLMVGGVGTRRGRRHPTLLEPGDTVDFWRVEALEEGRLLRLSAEMRLPGRAWLQFEVNPRAGGATIRQTAIFDPVGLFGLAYWYVLYPVHTVMFDGMLRGVADACERSHATRERGVEPPLERMS